MSINFGTESILHFDFIVLDSRQLNRKKQIFTKLQVLTLISHTVNIYERYSDLWILSDIDIWIFKFFNLFYCLTL